MRMRCAWSLPIHPIPAFPIKGEWIRQGAVHHFYSTRFPARWIHVFSGAGASLKATSCAVTMRRWSYLRRGKQVTSEMRASSDG